MKHFFFIFLLSFVTLASAANAKTEFGDVYKYCNEFQENNFETVDGGEVGTGFCIGVLSSWKSVAEANCYVTKNYGANVAGNVQGVFSGYGMKQLAFSVIKYAEQNPSDWSLDFWVLGGKIATSSNFKCKED